MIPEKDHEYNQLAIHLMLTHQAVNTAAQVDIVVRDKHVAPRFT